MFLGLRAQGLTWGSLTLTCKDRVRDGGPGTGVLAPCQHIAPSPKCALSHGASWVSLQRVTCPEPPSTGAPSSSSAVPSPLVTLGC